MTTYVKSENIFIYPTAHRQNGTTVYNPESKLNTEYNVTNQIAQLIGKKSKSFVVDYDTSDANNKILKLCMKGYFIEIQHAEDIMTGDSGLFARLKMINRGDVNYPHLIELCGNNESVDLDDNDAQDESVCYALQILNQTEYDSLSSDEKIECLIIKSNSGNYVPASSKTKFSLLDICNVDESPIISSKDDSAYGFNKVISSQENIETSKDMVLGYGGCLSLRGTNSSNIHLANENNSLEYSNVVNLPVDSGTIVLRDSTSDLISYRLPIAASTGNKHNKIANSTIEVLGSQTVGGGIYVREVSGNPINFDSSNQVKIQNISDSSEVNEGALIVSGGVGIAKKLNVGSNTTINGKLTVNNGIDSTNNVNDLGYLNFNFNNIRYGNYTNHGSMSEITQENWNGYLGLLNDSNYFYSDSVDGEKIKITPSTEYASNRTYYTGKELNFDEIEQVHIKNKTESREGHYEKGALTVSGGVGVGGNINVAGDLYANGDVKAHKFIGSLEGGLFTSQIDYSISNNKHKVIFGGDEPISNVIALSLPSHKGTFVCRDASRYATMHYDSITSRYEAIEISMVPLQTYNVSLDFISVETGSTGRIYTTSVSLGLIKIPSNNIEYDSCVSFTCRYCKGKTAGGTPVYGVFNGILHIYPNSADTSYVEVLDDSGYPLSMQTGLNYINISYERFE